MADLTPVVFDIARDTPDGYLPAGGSVRARPWARRVEGDTVIAPDRQTITIPVANRSFTFALAPTGPGWCWEIIEQVPGGQTRYVLVPPSSTPVQYVDLQDVDPDTLDPDTPAPAAWWVALEERTSATSIGERVEEYLQEHPPTSDGFAFTQAAPLATWTIPHGLGRLPSVDLYVAGVLVDADVAATATAVTVTFPTPTAGTAVLS